MKLEDIKAYRTLPRVGSTHQQWIDWYKATKNYFGAPRAAILFKKDWEKQGTQKANTYLLRKELAKDGIKIEETALNKVADLGGSALDVFDNIVQTGKSVSIVLVLMVTVGAGMLIYNVSQIPKRIGI